MAVLRLLEPTRPTIGSSVSIVRHINQNPSVRLWDLSICQVRKSTTETLANSEGWKESGPRFSQRFEPLISCPKAERRWTRAWKAGRRPVQDGRKSDSQWKKPDTWYQSESCGKKLFLKIIGRVVKTHSAIIFTGTEKNEQSKSSQNKNKSQHDRICLMCRMGLFVL